MLALPKPSTRLFHAAQSSLAPIAGAAVLLGLVLTVWCWARAASMSADGAHYMELAERAGRIGPSAGMDWYAGPGYPVVVAALYGLIPDLDFAGRLASLLFGLGTLLGVGLLARRLFDRSVAAAAVALLAVHTTFVRHAAMAETDAAYGCWLVWSCYLFWQLAHTRALARRALAAGAAGVTLGAGYLTRPEAVPLALLLGIWYLVTSPRAGRAARDNARMEQAASRAERLAWCAIIAIIGSLIALPYLRALHDELGRWCLSGKDRSIVLKLVPDKRNYERVLELGITGAILRHPWSIVHWLPYHVHWGIPQLVKALHPIVLCLAASGMLLGPKPRGARGAVRFLLWTSVPFLLFFFLTFPGRRYFMQTMPAWTILAAAGGVGLARRMAARIAQRLPGSARSAFTVTAALPIVFMTLCTVCANRTPLEASLRTERAIGERILAVAGPAHRVLSFTVTAFYARAERVPLWGPMQGIVRCHGYGKPLTYDEFRRYVARHRVEYVVLDHDLRKDCPEFLDRVRAEDFELVADDIRDHHGPCYVYRYRGDRAGEPLAN